MDIYLELAQNAFTLLQEIGEVDHDNAIEQGQNSYINYRKANDPARPMLKSLFGEEFTERLIGIICGRALVLLLMVITAAECLSSYLKK